VYGLPFTLALARRRLEEAELPREGLVQAEERRPFSAGAFTFRFFRVSHSIPDSAAVLVEAGGWRLFHSGDFKLDPDPPDGERTDRDGIAEAVGEGVDLALVDSTNAERPGRAASEGLAGAGLARVFDGAPGRIVLTTFSSHVARIRQAAEAALASRRRVGLLGRSMLAVSEIAERLGRFSLPAGTRVGPAELSRQPPDRLLCVTSGSQGEPFSALYRLALDEHADLKLAPGDLVVFSARTIPGHERSVNRVTDHLVRRGARVVREAEPPVHVSGHAHRDDIADWLRLVRPRAVMPVHGERRMLAAAADAARDAGIPADRVYVLDNGDRLTLAGARAGEAARDGAPPARIEPAAVPSGRAYYDDRTELVDAAVVRDRRHMAEEGFVVVFAPADPRSQEVAVVSRGVAADERELADEVRRAAKAVLARATLEEREDFDWLRAELAIAAKRACRRAFDIRPVIVPVVA
jgi:ribonuclease J